MMIVRNYYQSVREPDFSELNDCQKPNKKPKSEHLTPEQKIWTKLLIRHSKKKENHKNSSDQWPESIKK